MAEHLLMLNLPFARLQCRHRKTYLYDHNSKNHHTLVQRQLFEYIHAEISWTRFKIVLVMLT